MEAERKFTWNRFTTFFKLNAIKSRFLNRRRLNFFVKKFKVIFLTLFSWNRFAIFSTSTLSKVLTVKYRRPQENANWLRKVSLMKNPHFWWYQADILAIWPNHEVVILTKFHQNWTKIDNFLSIVHFLASSHSAGDVCKFKKQPYLQFPKLWKLILTDVSPQELQKTIKIDFCSLKNNIYSHSQWLFNKI